MMKRRVIAFDLDNTLADSKSPITEHMADLLNGLSAAAAFSENYRAGVRRSTDEGRWSAGR
jgi:FMN phosphatase YigB (HAD superfamily)